MIRSYDAMRWAKWYLLCAVALFLYAKIRRDISHEIDGGVNWAIEKHKMIEHRESEGE